MSIGYIVYFTSIFVLLATMVPLWADAASRREYGRRPGYLLLSIVLVSLLNLGQLLFMTLAPNDATRFSQAFLALHVSVMTVALVILEYSIHQQRIQKNHLWKAYRTGLQPIISFLSLSLIVTGLLFYIEIVNPTDPTSRTRDIGDLLVNVLFVAVLVFPLISGIMLNGLNGLQDGVIRRKRYPFIVNAVLLATIPLSLLFQNNTELPISLVNMGAMVLIFGIRLFHEYFFYRMNHLSDSYRKQQENTILRNQLINKVLRSSPEEDHAILYETVGSFMKQLEDSVSNKMHAFKSMVVYQAKGTRLSVRSPDFIYNFCSPLLPSEAVKRMNKDDNVKHIMSNSWVLDDLRQAPTGKPQDFATDAIRKAWTEKGPVQVEPLPGPLAAMYKLIQLYPVLNQGELIGMLVLYKDRDSTSHIYPQEDVILKAFTETLGIIFTIIQGKEVQEERNRLTGEMNTAKNIQTSILPKSIDIPGYEASAVMVTATEVGGDLYDYSVRGDANYINIGDVSGHGLPSGLMSLIQMSAFQSALITADSVHKKLGSSEIYDIVNKTLVLVNRNRIGSDKFMTCNIFEEKDGVFTHAGAHLPALVYRQSSNTIEELPGMTDRTAFLGISDLIQSKTSEASFKLESGDILVLYTDGLVEARDRDGRFFDTEGVKQVILENTKAPIVEIKEKILAKLASFAAAGDLKKYGGVYADDVSVMLLRKL